ncbi:hypothetical protein [Sneathiella glossodoripedis]|uniref:hypothetical protein n=1 Tax=Sneathiella glossodoripedis TaxID=418853 RepID=UPI0011DCC919|nr:hypothetical protein [Sneathiella glossodoripedis]
MAIFQSPRVRALDSAGDPLSGAKLYFYQAGTSTPEDTYTDAALSVAHANPVVADSEGKFATIYLQSLNYKVVLKDSSDTTIWTQDNVDGRAVADGSITLAKMADLTQGSLIVGGASDRPTELAYGQDGYVLTTKGASAEPEWTKLPYPPGYRSGFTVSINATDPDHDVDITAGYARDSTDTVDIVGSAMTKQLDATWVAGNNAGGLFSGTVAPNTRYYKFAIVKDSDNSVDYGFDTSSTAASIPSGYTYYLKIDQVMTDGSGNLINSVGDVFESDLQSITSAGLLTLAHGLSETPQLSDITVALVCQTTEHNWAVNDETVAAITPGDGGTGSSSKGSALYADSTNIYLRFGNVTNVYNVYDKTTGTLQQATNANWNVKIYARIPS